MATNYLNGTIKNVNHEKGFGFIREENGSRDFFFHKSAMGSDFHTVQGGERVSFEATTSPKGPRAENVELV